MSVYLILLSFPARSSRSGSEFLEIFHKGEKFKASLVKNLKWSNRRESVKYRKMYCGECAEGTAEALDAISKISGIYKYSYEVSFIYRWYM